MRKILVLIVTLCFIATSYQANATLKGPRPDGVKISSTVKEDRVYVEYDGLVISKVQVRLYDKRGDLLESTELSKNRPSFESDNLKTGTYWMTLKKDGKVSFERFIIS